MAAFEKGEVKPETINLALVRSNLLITNRFLFPVFLKNGNVSRHEDKTSSALATEASLFLA